MKPHSIKIQIGPKDQALFKYIIESYENIATVSTLNSREGIISIYIPSGNIKEMEKILYNLQKEIDFQIIEMR